MPWNHLTLFWAISVDASFFLCRIKDSWSHFPTGKPPTQQGSNFFLRSHISRPFGFRFPMVPPPNRVSHLDFRRAHWSQATFIDSWFSKWRWNSKHLPQAKQKTCNTTHIKRYCGWLHGWRLWCQHICARPPTFSDGMNEWIMPEVQMWTARQSYSTNLRTVAIHGCCCCCCSHKMAIFWSSIHWRFLWFL